MRPGLQLAGVAIAIIGTALWFFGGMQLRTPGAPGASSIDPQTEAAREAASGREPSLDFRPGVGFLAGCWIVGAAAWLAARTVPAPGKSKD